MGSSWIDFLALLLGVCVLLAGAGMWLGFADKDYQYSFQESSDQFPRYEGNLGYYDSLSAGQREIVDRALAGEAPRTETREEMPPPVVKRDGTYYVFNRYSYFDWGNPRTGGSAIVALVGLLTMAGAIYRDVSRRGLA